MYVPDDFALDDAAAVAEVIRRHGFAVLVTAVDGRAVASHLPFLFDPDRGAKGTLRAHMARANPQWRDLARLGETGGEALVVFQGPHAYVSPNWYGAQPAVPTWNYVAVHAAGTPRLVEEPGQVRAMLERLVRTHEAGLSEPWSLGSQDEAFVARMMRGIVAFEIPVARLEAKAKLNQNKRPEERRGAAAGLRAGGDPLADQVAALMENPAFGA
ncbi:MAG: FMN-binding negative transcriptional regulator [Kiloniellaceae bacterium]